MNKSEITRAFQFLLHLQNGAIEIEKEAKILEVHPRTIRRYIAAAKDVGLIVVKETAGKYKLQN